MIKDFKHYHKLFVLDRGLHFLLKYGNNMGGGILKSMKSVILKVFCCFEVTGQISLFFI